MAYYYTKAAAYPAAQQIQVPVVQGNAPVLNQQMPGYQDTKPKWSWASTGCSIFSVFCCFCGLFSPLFGLLGLVFSMTSYSDHKSGDIDGSKYKKKWAWGCTILAIVMGFLVIIAVAALGATFAASIASQIEEIWGSLSPDQQV